MFSSYIITWPPTWFQWSRTNPQHYVVISSYSIFRQKTAGLRLPGLEMTKLCDLLCVSDCHYYRMEEEGRGLPSMIKDCLLEGFISNLINNHVLIIAGPLLKYVKVFTEMTVTNTTVRILWCTRIERLIERSKVLEGEDQHGSESNKLIGASSTYVSTVPGQNRLLMFLNNSYISSVGSGSMEHCWNCRHSGGWWQYVCLEHQCF